MGTSRRRSAAGRPRRARVSMEGGAGRGTARLFSSSVVTSRPRSATNPSLRARAPEDHHLVAFEVGGAPRSPTSHEPATGSDVAATRRATAPRSTRGFALAALRSRSVELVAPEDRVPPPRIVDVADPGSPVMDVSEDGGPQPADTPVARASTTNSATNPDAPGQSSPSPSEGAPTRRRDAVRRIRGRRGVACRPRPSSSSPAVPPRATSRGRWSSCRP